MKRTLFRILAFPMPTRRLRNFIRRLGGDKKINIPTDIIVKNILNGYFDLSKTPPAYGFLKYIQAANLKLLKAFDTFATNNKIQYFMIGGAIVGKIRHDACIPWDDDIDIGMDGNNYEKFIAAIRKIIPNQHFYIYFSSNVCKIIHTETNSFIDILRYDLHQTPHCYSEIGEKIIIKSQNKFIHKVQNRRFLSFDITNDMSKDEICVKYNAVKKDLDEIRKLQKKYFKPCGGCQTIVPLHADCKPGEFYSQDTIYPIRKLEFNGYTLPFPNDMELYAAKCWGDIWNFPADMFRTHALTKNKTPQKLLNLRKFLSKSDDVIYADFSNNKG